MSTLPQEGGCVAVSYVHFPTVWQAVLFRNWGLVPVDKLCAVLGADEAALREAADALGLEAGLTANPVWLDRGYLTIIRENWHLLSLEQIALLLGISPERLAFLLKEDDFLWHKMGHVKPDVPFVAWAPLTKEQAECTARIRTVVREALPEGTRDNAFDFMHRFMQPLTAEARAEAQASVQDTDNLRTVYSYFALYGDPLIDPALDPFPEALLAEYAKMGVKGVWLQGLLYQLTLFPFAPHMSTGYEKRIHALNQLIARSAKYGIGVYLYLNEPRAMDAAFFAQYPHIRGRREGDFYAMCTSCPEVQAYLEEAAYQLFHAAKGLAGFFTITMSENLTNCYSRLGDGVPCPRCAQRMPEEVIAEVNNLLARGAKRANPKARAIAWSWGWGDTWAHKVPPLLTHGQIVQCNSEEGLETHVAGVKGAVADYTMSLCGPGEKARRVWQAALDAGLETCAKTQFNNTWELSAIPWLPVMDKVARHVTNLRQVGVRHFQMSWTLGGYPSPNLKLAAALMAGTSDVRSFLCDWLGENLGAAADAGQRKLSEAFSNFPFHIGTLYMAPQNYGPMAPLFLEKTGWQASMIGFPYDDLDSWRAIYTREQFREQFRLLCEGWWEGVDMLSAREGEHADYDDMLLMARAALCHFDSTYRQIAFVMARDAGDRDGMLLHLRADRENVKALIAIRLRDSRIGYEASNHYYYSLNDLAEKLMNLDDVERRITS
jgi:hypothetical protein